MITVIALALWQAAAGADCTYDRTQMLALSQQAFDQDLAGGWRPLAQRAECRLAAADLIRDYREARRNQAEILFWHEGQLRAIAGQTAQAIALFERARKAEDPFGWNPYVDATIAFLRGERAALLAARERLTQVPRPANFPERDANGRPTRWPLNLDVVDGFIACFGRPYGEAYGASCRPQP